jgi:hypothetical protein
MTRFQRELLLYYVFASPAVLVGVFFSVSLLANRSSIVHGLQIPYLDIPIATTLEFFVLGLIFYSLIKRKVSVLSVLPIVSFYLYMVGYGQQLRISPLASGITTSAVLVSTFCALASFNYSRAVEVSKGMKPILHSEGPRGFLILNSLLDFAFPIAFAVLLILAVVWLTGIFKEGFTEIPGPLSSLLIQYSSTNIGQATFGLVILGSILWIAKQLVEPILLNYSLLPSQAISLLISEEETFAKISIARELKITSLRGWFILSVAMLFVIIGTATYFSGFSYVTRNLISLFTGNPIIQNFDRLVYNGINSIADNLSNFVLQGENLIRVIFRILFG